jgi:kynureninase
MLKAHFRRVLESDPGRLHFAAHSHHPWPDVTFDAHARAWHDAARLLDDKWDAVFGEVVPEAQRHVAAELRLPDPSSLVFAPNTHEFVLRLLSVLPERPRVVTTDAEFHSFERQARRLEEDGLAAVERVPAEPFATFPARFVDAVRRARPQLVFFSHVFFNSGFVVPDLAGLVAALPEDTLVCVDGYHGFCGVETDLSAVAARSFYLAGGYKYAMAGEGACFLHVPPSATALRPRNTGWFAAFGALGERQAGRVPYASGGAHFLGATFDPSGLYRLNAVMRWRREVGLSTASARVHAAGLQRRFLGGLSGTTLAREPLVVDDEARRGRFLTFRTPRARALSEALKAARVITDARDDRLRFGFGPYQDDGDVHAALERLARLPQGA